MPRGVYKRNDTKTKPLKAPRISTRIPEPTNREIVEGLEKEVARLRADNRRLEQLVIQLVEKLL